MLCLRVKAFVLRALPKILDAEPAPGARLSPSYGRPMRKSAFAFYKGLMDELGFTLKFSEPRNYGRGG